MGGRPETSPDISALPSSVPRMETEAGSQRRVLCPLSLSHHVTQSFWAFVSGNGEWRLPCLPKAV